MERIPSHNSTMNNIRIDHSSIDLKYNLNTTKLFPRGRKNKRKKGKRKLDLRLDVVELNMIQDPLNDTMINDRDTVEKIKSSRFPRLR